MVSRFRVDGDIFENAHGVDTDLLKTDKNNCVFENTRRGVDGVFTGLKFESIM